MGGQGLPDRQPESTAQLDLLLLTVPTARRVHQDGIRVQGPRYVDLTLAAYVGEPVTVRYDPRDLAKIRAYHCGRFLRRAIWPERAGIEVRIKDLVRARKARRSELRTGIVGRAMLVDLPLRTVAPQPVLGAASATSDEPPPATPRLKRHLYLCDACRRDRYIGVSHSARGRQNALRSCGSTSCGRSPRRRSKRRRSTW